MAGLLDRFLTCKEAGDTVLSYSMQGKLYASGSGWILLSVPNSLVRGVFDALAEPGIELPPGKDGKPFNAHISVIRDDELSKIGGVDAITERGHTFHYTLGPLRTAVPDGWGEMSKVWMIEIESPELKRLRVSYGLPALPNNNQFAFHITCAVRRKHVLKENEISKGASALLQPPSILPLGPITPPKPTVMNRLQQAYDANQKNDYTTKINILRELMNEDPDGWAIDSEQGYTTGITHKKTRFRFHLPSSTISDIRPKLSVIKKNASDNFSEFDFWSLDNSEVFSL